MKKILVLGAGRSSGALIRYLVELSSSRNWMIIIGDLDVANAQIKVGDHPQCRAVYFNIEECTISEEAVHGSDVVISLLPPAYHTQVAKLCLRAGAHLLTASYVSDDMQHLHAEASARGLLFLNECGLDPGIDHMTAMSILDEIKNKGGRFTSFESFTGGLLHPETDPENPWRYKFTWNPRNVVTAGQNTARYKENGAYKFIPYHQLFRRVTSVVVPGAGRFEGYANRDSLKYVKTYGLEQVDTMIRGTLRNEGFCQAWDLLVQLGCCDDTFRMDVPQGMTHAEFISAFLPGTRHDLHDCLTKLSGGNDEAIAKLAWSGFLSDEPIGLANPTPAEVTQHILQKRWAMNPVDRDMIVMWHRFGYTLEGEKHVKTASLVVKGRSAEHTAMAETVGLPLAFAARLLLDGMIYSRGVVIPVLPEFYQPILKDLAAAGIVMNEAVI